MKLVPQISVTKKIIISFIPHKKKNQNWTTLLSFITILLRSDRITQNIKRKTSQNDFNILWTYLLMNHRNQYVPPFLVPPSDSRHLLSM